MRDQGLAQLSAAGCLVIAIDDTHKVIARLDDEANLTVLDGDKPAMPGWKLAGRLASSLCSTSRPA